MNDRFRAIWATTLTGRLWPSELQEDAEQRRVICPPLTQSVMLYSLPPVAETGAVLSNAHVV